MDLSFLVGPAMAVLFPQAAPWVRAFIAALVPALVELGEKVVALVKAKGTDPGPPMIKATAKLLDDAFDEIPEWRDLDEDERDAIIGGLSSLALFLVSLGRGGKAKIKIKKAMKRRLSKVRRVKL